MREERIGDCRLILGDCLEVMPTLGPVDAVVTDPPYGVCFPYNSYDDTPENLACMIPHLMRAVYSAKRAAITPGNTNVFRYPQPDWLGAWTWDTTTALGFWGWSQWQPILLYGDDVWPGTSSRGGLLKSDRIHFSGGQAKIDVKDGAGHTCPKPVTFMVRMVNRFTILDETVLDPFMGSGTTLVACAKLGRRGIGIEVDPGYFDIACRRVEEAYRQPDLFVERPPEPKQESMDW